MFHLSSSQCIFASLFGVLRDCICPTEEHDLALSASPASYVSVVALYFFFLISIPSLIPPFCDSTPTLQPRELHLNANLCTVSHLSSFMKSLPKAPPDGTPVSLEEHVVTAIVKVHTHPVVFHVIYGGLCAPPPPHFQFSI